MSPVLSVIMSVYNEPLEWISQSINSVLCQTFKDFEFIIVSDNPDGIEQNKMLQEYEKKDKRIKLLFNERNLGLANSLNLAIDSAKGELIARMDADDISHPDRFKIQYEYLKNHPEISLCGTWAKRFGDVPIFSYKCYKTPVTSEQVFINSYFSSPIIHPSIMGWSNIFKENKYNPVLRKAQDYELWERLLMKGYRICNIPQYLLKYRITLKSKNVKVISSQNDVADTVRNILLKQLIIDINENDLFIHNLICSNKKFNDKILVEKWLLKLRKAMINNHSSESLFINTLIDDLWFKFCLFNRLPLKDYYTSTLYSGISIVNMLRIFKHNIL